MYKDLAWTWPIISSYEEYEEGARQFVEAIGAHAKIEVKSILDMGSGGGHNDIHLKKHYKVTGLDLSPKMIENARKLNPDVEYIEGDMRTARLDKKFDTVLLADAVMYMSTEEDLLAAFKTAFHHLNPGGVLCTYAEIMPESFKENRTEISHRGSGDVEIVYMENQRRTGSRRGGPPPRTARCRTSAALDRRGCSSVSCRPPRRRTGSPTRPRLRSP